MPNEIRVKINNVTNMTAAASTSIGETPPTLATSVTLSPAKLIQNKPIIKFQGGEKSIIASMPVVKFLSGKSANQTLNISGTKVINLTANTPTGNTPTGITATGITPTSKKYIVVKTGEALKVESSPQIKICPAGSGSKNQLTLAVTRQVQTPPLNTSNHNQTASKSGILSSILFDKSSPKVAPAAPSTSSFGRRLIKTKKAADTSEDESPPPTPKKVNPHMETLNLVNSVSSINVPRVSSVSSLIKEINARHQAGLFAPTVEISEKELSNNIAEVNVAVPAPVTPPIPRQKFKCGKCKAVFYTRKKLDKHAGDSKRCAACGQMFPSLFTKKRHCKMHHSEGGTCLNCEKIFFAWTDITSHMCLGDCDTVENDPENMERFPCEICKQKFLFESNLSNHLVVCKARQDLRTCPGCDKVFSTFDGCRQHKRGCWKVEVGKLSDPTLKCPQCKQIFTSMYPAQMHVRSQCYKYSTKAEKQRALGQITDQFSGYQKVCPLCDEVQPSEEHLDCHLRLEHRDNLTCVKCYLDFNQWSELRLHKLTKHPKKGRHKVFTMFQTRCPLCPLDKTFYEREAFKEHVESKHEYTDHTESHTFKNWEQFIDWKKAKEAETSSSFVKAHKTVDSQKNIHHSYRCHREREYVSDGTAIGEYKKEVTCKTGYLCLADMNVKVTPNRGQVVVKFRPEHFGHNFDCRHNPNYSKRELLGKMKREKALSNETQQKTKSGKRKATARPQQRSPAKAKKRRVQSPRGRTSEQSDSQSVDEIVTKLRASPGLDPVLCFKPQRKLVGDYPLLLEDDFLLGIQSEDMLEIFKRFSYKTVCIDLLRQTNQYNFTLSTVFIINDLAEAVPVAWLISSRLSSAILEVFFQSIRDRSGLVYVEEFMSFDNPVVHQCWCNAFGEPHRKLLSTWHVDRVWRENVERYTAEYPAIAEEIYHHLNILYFYDDLDSFPRRLTAFERYVADACPAFYYYFHDNYSSRWTEWAVCARQNVNWDTDNVLLSFGSQFKEDYLSGGKNKRVDNLIRALLAYADDKIFLDKSHGKRKKKSVTLLSFLEKEVDEEMEVLYVDPEEDEELDDDSDYEPPVETGYTKSKNADVSHLLDSVKTRFVKGKGRLPSNKQKRLMSLAEEMMKLMDRPGS